jgi:predicted transcriptional regulator
MFIDEQLERELQALAKRAGRPVAALVREAVEQYVVAARAQRPARLQFIAAGRSGRTDVASRHEDLLFERADPARGSRPPAPGSRPPRANRRPR